MKLIVVMLFLWFGGNIDNKVFESAITFWFKDVDFDGDKVWEYFHMNN